MNRVTVSLFQLPIIPNKNLGNDPSFARVGIDQPGGRHPFYPESVIKLVEEIVIGTFVARVGVAE